MAEREIILQRITWIKPLYPSVYIEAGTANVCYNFTRITSKVGVMNKEQVISILGSNRSKMRPFHVKDLYLFGSVARGEETTSSDIDILVEFEPDTHIGLFGFARLQRMLSELLGCEVDLATPEALHGSLKSRILKEATRAA
jgi:hypothetical protein